MGTKRQLLAVLTLLAAVAAGAPAQEAGPSAPSPAEARALGYMHTVMSAQREYRKRHGEYARSQAALVGKGSFTRRMVNPERGDYLARFSGTGAGYSLALTPKSFDQQHRAFFVNESGVIRAEAEKPATAQSAPLK